MNDNKECCNGDMKNLNNSAQQGLEQKECKEEMAEQLLAAKDATGMDLESATQALVDENIDEEKKADAEDMLALADASGLNLQNAEKLIGEKCSNENVGK